MERRLLSLEDGRENIRCTNHGNLLLRDRCKLYGFYLLPIDGKTPSRKKLVWFIEGSLSVITIHTLELPDWKGFAEFVLLMSCNPEKMYTKYFKAGKKTTLLIKLDAMVKIMSPDSSSCVYQVLN